MVNTVLSIGFLRKKLKEAMKLADDSNTILDCTTYCHWYGKLYESYLELSSLPSYGTGEAAHTLYSKGVKVLRDFDKSFKTNILPLT